MIHSCAGPADSSAERKRVVALKVLTWKAEDQELVRLEIPLWMMRFSFSNLMSQAGLGFGSLNLTTDDVQRYGPGVIADFKTPDGNRVLVWAQ